eukprot:CAMPEP_0168350968 /NCGR_PEP_ID=MMETSP0213-20121227/21503_1 /TAXON_ID=151035 /ORGANISM="Euplotes harpa, Strain FSP1.4" /LENGTH=155 /DNA_ID=CAMNT_0008361553 /DNA_START=16 /DNA_END=483 /DNA_ORIENTATION=+
MAFVQTDPEDSYPKQYRTFRSILDFSAEGAQTGALYAPCDQDLMDMDSQYVKSSNIFRPFDIGNQDEPGVALVSLGPSCFDIRQSNATFAKIGQKAHLRNDNILRPRRLAANDYHQDVEQAAVIATRGVELGYTAAANTANARTVFANTAQAVYP